MIGKLRGLVDSTGADWVLLDVGGVGYHVQCSTRTLGALPPVGEAASLLIETHVREDQITLYGFSTQTEKDCYHLLCTVQGVGARVGLALLSALSAQDIMGALAARDKTALTRANGVGPKLAQRIVNELKDKILSLEAGADEETLRPAGQTTVPEDAVSALVNLGYRRAEAFDAISKVSSEQGAGQSIENLIRAGLKELMP